MNLQGERVIAASPDATWAALNDPETLKACIAGCETLERVADDEYLATMAMRIGPVNARLLSLARVRLPAFANSTTPGNSGSFDSSMTHVTPLDSAISLA